MIRRLRKTARAEADIRGITFWIARDSVDAALKWAGKLEEQLRRLLDTPGIGTDRNELRPKLRSVPFGDYLIFFKPMRDGVTIVRVIHGSRDYARLFRKD